MPADHVCGLNGPFFKMEFDSEVVPGQDRDIATGAEVTR